MKILMKPGWIFSVFVKKKVGVFFFCFFFIGRKEIPKQEFLATFFFLFGNIWFDPFIFTLFLSCSIRKKRKTSWDRVLFSQNLRKWRKKCQRFFIQDLDEWTLLHSSKSLCSWQISFSLVTKESFSYKSKSQWNQYFFFDLDNQRLFVHMERVWILKIGYLWLHIRTFANEKKKNVKYEVN